MKQEILTHLRNRKPNAGGTLAKYLRTGELRVKTQQEVKEALEDLLQEESIRSTAAMPIDQFNGLELSRPMSEFPGEFDSLRITWQGERRWEEVEAFVRAGRVDESLMASNRSQVATNQSLIETNKSIRSLNKFQYFVSSVTLLVALGSLVAISTSNIYAKRALEAKESRELVQQLDTMKQYLNGIDSSLRRVTNDTTLHNHRRGDTHLPRPSN